MSIDMNQTSAVLTGQKKGRGGGNSSQICYNCQTVCGKMARWVLRNANMVGKHLSSLHCSGSALAPTCPEDLIMAEERTGGAQAREAQVLLVVVVAVVVQAGEGEKLARGFR